MAEAGRGDAVGRGRKELDRDRYREHAGHTVAEFKMILRLCWCKGIAGVLRGDWGSQGRSLLSEEDKRFTVGCGKRLEPWNEVRL